LAEIDADLLRISIRIPKFFNSVRKARLWMQERR
jgi:hypothetical protein